jgi:hypothetical protein
MFSFRFNSLAMRSSPQVGFSEAVSRMPPQILGDSRSANRPGFPAPEEPESLAVPVEEGIGLDVHQGGTPREHAAQNHHDQASGVMCPVRFHLALLKQRELFAQEEVLGSRCAARPKNEHEETDEFARD